MALVLATAEAGTLESLVVGKSGKDTKDHGGTGVELDAHEAVAHGVTDVLKVHGRALDEHTDSDDGVKLADGRGSRRRLGTGSAGTGGVVNEREEVGSSAAEERGSGVGGLGLAASDEPGDGQ